MMRDTDRPYRFDRVVRVLGGAGILIGLVWCLAVLSDVLIPFAAAFVLAYLINPLVERIQRWVPNRAAAVFACLFLIVGVLVLLVWVIAPLIAGEVAHMGRIVSELAGDSEIARRAARLLPENLWGAIRNLLSHPGVRSLFEGADLMKTAEFLLRKVMPGVWGLIAGTASFLMGVLGLAVIGLYLVFLLLDYKKFSQGWMEFVPGAYRAEVVGFVQDFESVMNRYFRGQVAVAGICGVLLAAGFYFIDLPMGILLGLFTGLLNIVPYLQIIGMIPALLFAVFLAIENGSGIWAALGLTGGVFALVQVAQDLVLVPRIMGKVTGLNPAMILLSLSIWGKLLGMLGLIIALPMTYLLLVYYRRILAAGSTPSPAGR